MIEPNVPIELLATVYHLAGKLRTPDSVPLELQELLAALADHPADVWKGYLQLHRLSCGTWGSLHAFRVGSERPYWPEGTDPYGVLTLCGAHAATWTGPIERIDDTNTASACAVCAKIKRQIDRATGEVIADAKKDRDALAILNEIILNQLSYLRSLDKDALPGAVERTYWEMDGSDRVKAGHAAYAALLADLHNHERVRVEADVAAITAVLPDLIAVLGRMGGNSDLADRVHALHRRLRDHYEGKPFGHRLLEALAFYANPRAYTLDPAFAVEQGLAADDPSIDQDRGRMARIALGREPYEEP